MNAQRLLLDGTIRTLPSDIIENIIWRLPTEEIVRASVLSKEWRYNWTKIPKVVFYEDLFDKCTNEIQLLAIEQMFGEYQREKKEMSSRCKLFNAIYQFLLLHQGPLVDFTLSMTGDMSCEYIAEIDQILLHLSRRNTIKKLCLISGCELPSSIFSFHQLTDLYLCGCSINHPPTLNGFGSLTTLWLKYVCICLKDFMHILSNNPQLKSFTMLEGGGEDTFGIINEDEYVTVNELFQCLPVIEHLTLCAWNVQCFITRVVPREVATSLVHLKYLYFEEMRFYEDDWLRFLILMIRSSPNLEKLKLKGR
ncbi:F-box/FBD/LRR-repeat protein At1g13570-like isoform X2 [Rutidosis leptorrhynchoides]|uniref:F-box/FBD/LRR-repeat protein At1g13570-like isoform X2 n=1 Tax=Rutidosis leptorrhynchoides TaxID=125765 RepID=UPI003A9992B2